MGVLEVISTGVIASLILYNINRTDHVDGRLDKINERLIHVETLLPKRKEDRSYYSENSGIEL